jgi:hypothetical protein
MQRTRYGIATGPGRVLMGRPLILQCRSQFIEGCSCSCHRIPFVWHNSGSSHPLRILIRQTAGAAHLRQPSRQTPPPPPLTSHRRSWFEIEKLMDAGRQIHAPSQPNDDIQSPADKVPPCPCGQPRTTPHAKLRHVGTSARRPLPRRHRLGTEFCFRASVMTSPVVPQKIPTPFAAGPRPQAAFFLNREQREVEMDVMAHCALPGPAASLAIVVGPGSPAPRENSWAARCHVGEPHPVAQSTPAVQAAMGGGRATAVTGSAWGVGDADDGGGDSKGRV